ncbi:MAG: LacI family DNA-binding transcriptional regulator [bacterium]|nr:LacI family DNA-binding transcriptional regulator [Candidatus Sumerlaeota bacterium]
MRPHPRQKRPTIRDIARMAGVSRSTVSLAINDSPRINVQTKAHVLELIEKVGYRPNQAARNLVRQHTRTIFVILPQLAHVVSDTYFSESLSGILDVTTPHGYHLMVEESTPEFKERGQALKLFRQGAMDGVLCVGGLTTDKFPVELFEAGCPVALVNSSLAGVPQVLADNNDAAFRAVKHLYDLGHRRIAHIRGSEFVTTALDRTAGYLRALKMLVLPMREEYLAQGYFDQGSGRDAMRWLLTARQRPTAVFSTNDMMAIGAMDAIREAGLRMPEDIAIFGGDDIQLARYIKPALATMRQPMDLIAQTACEMLLRQIKGGEYEKKVKIKLELVIRESCGTQALID